MDHSWRMAHRVAWVLIGAALVVVAGCSSAPKQSTEAAPSAAPASASQPSNSNASDVKFDFNAVFPPGPGREMVIDNCTTCHTIVPIVVLQLNDDAWKHWRTIHRSRVPGMTDADFNTLYDYLRTNFNPSKPVPKLPQDLLDTWTTY